MDARNASTLVGTKAEEAPPSSQLGSRVVVSRDQLFGQHEHAAAVARMQRILPLAMVLWLGFFSVDFVLATWVAPGPLRPYALIRLIVLVPIIIAWALVRGETTPSPRRLLLLDLLMTSSCAAGLTAMCLLSGGLTSPYNSYVPLVLVGHNAVLPDHWKEGMLRLGVPALINPLMLGAIALVDSEVAAQFVDPGSRGTFFFYVMLLFGAWVLLVFAGHNVWTLRRQVFRSRSIGQYRLEQRIGSGSMGEVWVAYHDRLRRKVALKILRPDWGSDPRSIARFEREILATAALTHPNTIRIYDHGVTPDGLWFYAMELLEGRDLGTIVKASGPVDPDRALHLMLQAARAVAEAHRAQIVHRDIKPANLFVTALGGESDFVKILDFGLAKMEEGEGATELTRTGVVTGTPAFISPEVAVGKPADARSDVYGLGATFYYALTNTLPFSADNVPAMLLKHLHEDLQPPSTRMAVEMPPDFEAAIMRCMAKDPEDRFANADALAAALAVCQRETLEPFSIAHPSDVPSHESAS